MNYPQPKKIRNYKPAIIGLTVFIYLGVAFASYIPGVEQLQKYDLTVLPKLNAIINSLNFLALAGAWGAILKKNLKLHKAFIFTALALTSLFLISYLTYHIGAESTKYGGEGFIKSVYYFILITHIILAAAIVPLALTAIARGFNMEVARHRKIARWAMPIWLYVSITGVIVYLMIAPYYGT